MHELEFLKSMLACRLEELNELIRMVDVRLDMLRTCANACSESRG